MENSADFFYEKLRNDEKPGQVLAAFYCQMFDKPVTRSEIIMFNKLLKTFHRFLIFYAIVDTGGSKPEGLDNPYPYIYEICKRRFEAAHSDTTIQSRRHLDRYIESIDEEIEKNSKKKLKIPSSEGLG